MNLKVILLDFFQYLWQLIFYPWSYLLNNSNFLGITIMDKNQHAPKGTLRKHFTPRWTHVPRRRCMLSTNKGKFSPPFPFKKLNLEQKRSHRPGAENTTNHSKKIWQFYFRIHKFICSQGASVTTNYRGVQVVF